MDRRRPVNRYLTVAQPDEQQADQFGTALMYLALAAIVAIVILTATSAGRIDWDESGLILMPLVALFLVLGFLRRRSSSQS